MTAIRLPFRSLSRASFVFARTRTLPPSTKIGRLKSTFFIRASVIVDVPHSASALPLATSVESRRRVDRQPFDLELLQLELALHRKRRAHAELDAVAADPAICDP